MAMMREHIDYKNDWIIGSGCLNNMIDDQSGAMEEGWPSENEVLQDLDNIEKILPQKTGEQIVHICLIADVRGDLSDTNVSEQEVTQSREFGKKMTPQQLR